MPYIDCINPSRLGKLFLRTIRLKYTAVLIFYTRKGKNMDEKMRNAGDPAYDGFFTSSIASANESTGYAVTVPDTEEEAEALGDLGSNPNTACKHSKTKGKAKKKK